MLAGAASGLLLAAPETQGADSCPLTAIPQGSSASEFGPPSISADGRFLAFASRTRLVTLATGTGSEIYVLDLMTQTLTVESPLPSDSLLSSDSRAPSISSDGRFLVFEWVGTSRGGSAPPEHKQIMLRDRRVGTIRMLSVNGSAVPGDQSSSNAVLSADGRVVAFESLATNLVPGTDVNGADRDIYIAVLATGAITRASLDTSGLQREGPSFAPAVSADGRYVAFTSDARLDEASALGDARTDRPHTGRHHVFVRDLARGITRRVSRRPDGSEPNGASFLPSINSDGRWLAFVSNATDLAAGDTKDVSNIFLHDLEASTTTLVSRGVDGAASDGASTRPVLSGSGHLVAFESVASNLVCGKRCRPLDLDINLLTDVFVFDRDERSIVRLSSDSHSGWMEASGSPALDASGRVAAFSSRHPIADHDTRNDFDLFVVTPCGDGTTVQR
ncbi:Tol-Pal system beta propeller repeat protein TolB [Luteitalea pratensis]|uniref:Tol-Pal system beta propeller repeat protein TolB n=2 Tax=Luteitalea pratensis TaxID=1855912 RepID=A0A143PLP6_LUTPR|nr:Tol-Pal system beta propeller repeat protein TolB [Luteitalea pratensis]